MTDTQSIAVIGLGVNNRPLVPYFLERGARVIAADRLSLNQLHQDILPWLAFPGFKVLAGPDYLDRLVDEADLRTAYLTPGMVKDLPQIQTLAARGVGLTSETDLFLSQSVAPVLGITGSAGKTTTTTVVGKALELSGVHVVVGGNIGRSLLPELKTLSPSMWAVMELSSFQLDLVEHSPQGAVWLNLAPNHLDVHGSMQAYTRAKRHVLEFQDPSRDWVVLPAEDPGVLAAAENFGGRRYYVGLHGAVPAGAYLDGGTLWWRAEAGKSAEPVVAADAVVLPGRHNLFNLLAATAAVMLAGGDLEAIAEVAKTFVGVAHRLEWVRTVNQVAYVNDSIATAPDRTFAALAAIKGRMVLIAGGYDKHLDYSEFGLRVAESNVHTVVLMGQTAEKIAVALRLGGAQCEVVPVDSLEAAVEAARSRAYPGETVLLSPASASYDMFSSFEERGLRFREIVGSL